MSAYPNFELPTVCGIAITAADGSIAIRQIITLAKSRRPASAFTMNLDHTVQLRRNEQFRAAYATADVVTADGWPIAWLARRQRRPVERTTGADLFLPLIDQAAQEQLPVFLFGSTPGVVARVGEELVARTEGRVPIAGSMSPSQKFDPTGVEADEAIKNIRASGAALCFVAVGAPKQEIFANYARSKGLKCCFVCVGAALDFVAGKQLRAPAVLRNHGMEWAWRLATNPSRLSKRYAECAGMFFYLLATEPLLPAPAEDWLQPAHQQSARTHWTNDRSAMDQK
ncbi:MAG: WecB/TagA/CpsF family glycosyltransferase [Hyphomicrobium sp.]|nr:WecB/TagA/CpsF family glycosyltransferase [Hyphomicrobium sp.]